MVGGWFLGIDVFSGVLGPLVFMILCVSEERCKGLLRYFFGMLFYGLFL